MPKASEDTDDGLKVGCVKSHFLDSGSFTLKKEAAKFGRKHKCNPLKYYDTEDFYAYVDAYAAFLKKYSVAIDLYASVDVIPNPELSFRNLKYMEEKHGLKPVPVVHYGTDLKWLKKYMEEGYELIGLGGLVGSTKQEGCKGWIDRCFDMVCDQQSRLPMVKLHGFGVTYYDLLLRYPWWSVDSTSWTLLGAYGLLRVPHKRGGKFIFSEPPYTMATSLDSPAIRKRGNHVLNIRPDEKKIVLEWLDEIGIPLGKVDKEGNVIEHGVLTRHIERRAANIRFFEKLRASLPEYPWAFRSTKRKGFGLL